MSIVYNAEEIYRIGIEIEKNGKRFYALAAGKCAHEDVKKLLLELSGWEDTHVALLERLHRELPAGARSEALNDPDGEVQKYLKAIADGHVFLQRGLDIDAVAASCRDVPAVLDMALRFEKDSVVLYAAVREAVTERMGRETIARLLQEEIAHVAMIQEQVLLLEDI